MPALNLRHIFIISSLMSSPGLCLLPCLIVCWPSGLTVIVPAQMDTITDAAARSSVPPRQSCWMHGIQHAFILIVLNSDSEAVRRRAIKMLGSATGAPSFTFYSISLFLLVTLFLYDVQILLSFWLCTLSVCFDALYICL